MMTLLRFHSLLCLFCLLSGAVSACDPSTCDHGSCHEDKCQCEPNYTGPDCSLPFQICPDGDRTCYNGSVCVRNNERDPVTKKYKYHCDCSKAFGVSPYAGLQCENAATSSCEQGGGISRNAFCTNGGECVREVRKGDAHPGCYCDDSFEGIHCQYLKGQAPSGDLTLTGRGGESGLTGVVIFIIIVVVLGVVGLFAFVVWKKHHSTKETKEAVEVTDLHLESEKQAEGEIL